MSVTKRQGGLLALAAWVLLVPVMTQADVER